MIASGGKLSNVNGLMANDATSTFTATVTGAGSTWINTGRLDVGVAGDAELKILNGGMVSSQATTTPSTVLSTIGRAATSDSTVLIQGEGSKWSALSLEVGGFGKGTLNVNNGGELTGGVTIAAEPPAPGEMAPVSSVNISGTGKWTNGGAVVGDAGEGELNVTGGGKVSLGGMTIGFLAGSKGTVNIDGAGSDVTMTSDLTVATRGVATLNLRNGATMSNAFGYVGASFLAGATGTVHVESGSAWTNNGALSVGGSNSTGIMTVSGGGKVTATGTSPDFGSNIGGKGGVTVEGVGSMWTNTVIPLAVGGNGGTGTLDILNGGVVSNGHGYVAPDLGNTGVVTVNGAGSTWTSNGELIVGRGGNGILHIENSAAVTSTTGRIGAGPGSVGVVNVGAGCSWTMTSTLEIGYQGSAVLSIGAGGTVAAPGGTTIDTLGSSGMGSGKLSGTGTLSSNVTNNGVVAPGTSPGTLNVVGNFFQSSGTLQIEIASPTSFDVLNVSGQATMFGKLEIILLGGFIPAATDSYAILSAGSMGGGSFSEVTVTANSMNAGTFSIGFGTAGITLSNFVPSFIPGDFDADGDVDGADFVIWQTNFPAGSGHVLATGDADGDGDVDGADFVVWQTNFPYPPAAGVSPVPEPRAWLSAIIAVAVAGLRWRTLRRVVEQC
jgi:T5SS/PEP-CTERM-associated repeat protein